MKYTADDAKKILPNGWAGLVDEAFELAKEGGFKILRMKNKMGWLSIQTRGTVGPRDYAELRGLEANSEKTCMHCGRYGKRRVNDINHIAITLCEDCYEQGVILRRGKTIPFLES